MKYLITEALEFLKNYRALKELEKHLSTEKVRNHSFFKIVYAWKNNKTFHHMPRMIKALKTLPEKEQSWILKGAFDKKDILDMEEEELEVLSEKIFLCQEMLEIVTKKKQELERIEKSLSAESFTKVLHSIRMGKISSQELSKLVDKETLEFLNHHPDLDIAPLFMMSDENRAIYIREYQESLRAIVEYEYTGISDLKPSVFQKAVALIKERFPDDFCTYAYVRPYDMLEALAFEYHDSEETIIEFVLEAFPDYESILEEGRLPDSFKRLVEKITENKTKEELDTLKEQYYNFLNTDYIAMKELRYRTILREDFIESENKEHILELLDCEDRVEYQNKERVLQEQRFFSSPKLDLMEQTFIKASPTKEMLGERVHLVFALKGMEKEIQSFLFTRMENITRLEDAKKINKLVDQELQKESEILTDKALLESLPGKEEKFVTDDYTISVYNMATFLENSEQEELEITKGPLKLVIYPKKPCKK